MTQRSDSTWSQRPWADFDHLAQQQLLTCTHGGAVSTATAYNPPLCDKIARHAGAKMRIAHTAVAMAPLGGTVAPNGGTTATTWLPREEAP